MPKTNISKTWPNPILKGIVGDRTGRGRLENTTDLFADLILTAVERGISCDISRKNIAGILRKYGFQFVHR